MNEWKEKLLQEHMDPPWVNYVYRDTKKMLSKRGATIDQCVHPVQLFPLQPFSMPTFDEFPGHYAPHELFFPTLQLLCVQTRLEKAIDAMGEDKKKDIMGLFFDLFVCFLCHDFCYGTNDKNCTALNDEFHVVLCDSCVKDKNRLQESIDETESFDSRFTTTRRTCSRMYKYASRTSGDLADAFLRALNEPLGLFPYPRHIEHIICTIALIRPCNSCMHLKPIGLMHILRVEGVGEYFCCRGCLESRDWPRLTHKTNNKNIACGRINHRSVFCGVVGLIQ